MKINLKQCNNHIFSLDNNIVLVSPDFKNSLSISMEVFLDSSWKIMFPIGRDAFFEDVKAAEQAHVEYANSEFRLYIDRVGWAVFSCDNPSSSTVLFTNLICNTTQGITAVKIKANQHECYFPLIKKYGEEKIAFRGPSEVPQFSKVILSWEARNLLNNTELRISPVANYSGYEKVSGGSGTFEAEIFEHNMVYTLTVLRTNGKMSVYNHMVKAINAPYPVSSVLVSDIGWLPYNDSVWDEADLNNKNLKIIDKKTKAVYHK